MTFRGTPGDREALETGSTEAQLQALGEFCEIFDVPADEWTTVRLLYPAVAATAVWGFVRRLCAEGETETHALNIAEAVFGVPRTTALGWRDRIRRDLQEAKQDAA